MIVIYAVDHEAYIVACDVDACDGVGAVFFGPRENALQFPDVGAALEYWKKQSTVRPVRMDGRPNRPLSALTVELQRLEE